MSLVSSAGLIPIEIFPPGSVMTCSDRRSRISTNLKARYFHRMTPCLSRIGDACKPRTTSTICARSGLTTATFTRISIPMIRPITPISHFGMFSRIWSCVPRRRVHTPLPRRKYRVLVARSASRSQPYHYDPPHEMASLCMNITNSRRRKHIVGVNLQGKDGIADAISCVRV